MPSLNTGNAILSNAITVDGSYNVGIGTSSPSQKLSISYSDGGAQTTIYNTSTGHSVFANNTADKDMNYQVSGTGGHYFVGGVNVQSGNILSIYRTDNTRALQFYTTANECVIDSWAASSEPLMIRSNGSGGRIVFHTNGAERMRITSGGEVLIGKSAKNYTVSGAQFEDSGSLFGVTRGVAGENIFCNRINSSTGNFILFYYNSGSVGSISTNGTTTSYNITSDYRLKKDLKDYNGLDLVSKIKTYDFAWNVDNTRMYGVIAHELQDIVPYAVSGIKDAENEDGSINPQGVDYSKIVPVLVKAIQELNQTIQNQQQQINQLINK